MSDGGRVTNGYHIIKVYKLKCNHQPGKTISLDIDLVKQNATVYHFSIGSVKKKTDGAQIISLSIRINAYKRY